MVNAYTVNTKISEYSPAVAHPGLWNGCLVFSDRSSSNIPLALKRSMRGNVLKNSLGPRNGKAPQ